VHTWREPLLVAAVEFNTGIARSEREHTCVTSPVALLAQIARRGEPARLKSKMCIRVSDSSAPRTRPVPASRAGSHPD
jgi:hypothetical protein